MIVTIIVFVLIFGVVVIAHELGHFLIAKLNGIKVLQFSIGMGPDIIKFTKGETKYVLKLFPIGGACMFEGEDGVYSVENETENPNGDKKSEKSAKDRLCHTSAMSGLGLQRYLPDRFLTLSLHFYCR